MAGKKGMKGVKPHDESERYPEYYKKRYPEMSDEECIAKAAWFKKSCTYQCIEYYEKRYPELTHEEHLKMLHDKKSAKKQVDHKREDNYQCIEYYEKRYPELTHEEHERLLSEAKASYLAKRPDNSGENNPAHKSHTTEKQRRERSVLCIEYYEKKYPELTHEEQVELMNKKVKDVNERKSKADQPTRLQYYINKGYSVADAKKALSERQRTFTLEKCIEKYGEAEGTRIFEERQTKWQRSLHNKFKEVNELICTSGISNSLIQDIRNYGIDIESEYPLGRYSFDMRYNNKLIEFNGDYWHANPVLYDDNFVNKVIGKTASEIHEKDNRKIQFAKDNGYDILTIWEYDYKLDPEGVLKKCINFLND